MRSLFFAAAELQSFLLEQRWRFCFIGGIALQRWGEPRLTLDVDVSLLTGLGAEKDFVDGLCRRYPKRIPDAVEFALQNRVLLLQTQERIPLDIALAAFPFEEQVIERSSTFPFLENVELRTCSAEDLVILKAFGDRSRDWADIDGVLIRQGRVLDRRYVEQHLSPLCELKGQPDIARRLSQLWDRLVQGPGC